MVLRSSLILFAVFLFADFGHAEHTLHSITFPTKHAAPGLAVPSQWKTYADMYYRMAHSVPERSVVNAGLLAAQQRKMISQKAASGLNITMNEWYAKLEDNPAFKGVASALPYNLSVKKEKHGHAFVLVPQRKSTLPPIVFLHGFGGNFQVYAQWFMEYYPDRLVVLASHGVNWQYGSQDYLDDVYAAAHKQLNVTVEKPWLLAMSAGGPAGFKIYDRHHAKYRGLIAIATSPRSQRKLSKAKDLTVGVISGRRDARFSLALVKTRLWTWNKAAIYDHKVLDADHYFMLNSAGDTAAWMRLFMAQAEAKS